MRDRDGSMAATPSEQSMIAFTSGTLAVLQAKGHHIVEPMGQTSANSIEVTPDGLLGAPDPRTRGSEAAGN